MIVTVLRWPFLFVLNARSQRTGWALVNGPIVTPEQRDQFAELRRAGYRFAGMSSYMTFPVMDTADTLDYEALCEVWCHCFREPDRFLSTAMPHALISISDFTDYQRITPEFVVRTNLEESFDFIYVGATEEWKRQAKNWQLAARCIPRLCQELRLRCLVIGTPTGDFPSSHNVIFRSVLRWDVFLGLLARARLLFVPNICDASPRLLAEALCLNVPLVVNRSILGGWKYVNRFTGVFFTNEKDITAAVQACCEQTVAPREWFRANYGPYLAGRRLFRLLTLVDSGISERSHVRIAEHEEESSPAR